MNAQYVCNKCGEPAEMDTRMGGGDVYLTCGCDRNGEWVDDGRGGYYDTDAQPVLVQEPKMQKPKKED